MKDSRLRETFVLSLRLVLGTSPVSAELQQYNKTLKVVLLWYNVQHLYTNQKSDS